MPVADWFWEYVPRLTARVPLPDWPDLGTDEGREYFATIEAAFVRRGVTEEVADLAAQVVAESPPQFRRDVLPALLKAAGDIFATMPAGNAPATPEAERQAAKDASAGCRWCDGEGVASVVRKDGQDFGVRTAGGHWIQQRSVAVVCECSFGRWTLARQKASKDRDGNAVRPMLDLLAVKPWVQPVLEALDDEKTAKFAAEPNSMTAFIRRMIREASAAGEDVESPEVNARMWGEIGAKMKADAAADRREANTYRVADHVAEKLRDEAASLAKALKSAHAGPVDDPAAIEAARAKAEAARQRHEQARAARQAEPEPVEAWDESQPPF